MTIRETILEADDIGEEIVTIPEWGDVKILLRGMDGTQHSRYIDTAEDTSHRYADILINAAFDPDTNERVFDPADRDALMHKHGGVLMRLALIVMRDLSGSDIGEATEELEADPTSDGS